MIIRYSTDRWNLNHHETMKLFFFVFVKISEPGQGLGETDHRRGNGPGCRQRSVEVGSWSDGQARGEMIGNPCRPFWMWPAGGFNGPFPQAVAVLGQEPLLLWGGLWEPRSWVFLVMLHANGVWWWFWKNDWCKKTAGFKLVAVIPMFLRISWVWWLGCLTYLTSATLHLNVFQIHWKSCNPRLHNSSSG